MEKPPIGFIGLGVMGAPMARHLAAAGHRLTIHDVNRAAADALAGDLEDITVAATPRDVAAASDIVITMLPSGREVRDVALGESGLAEGFKPGSLLLDTSSAEPWHTTEIAARLRDIGVAMVDAPVSGAEAGAKNAELVFMVGGAPEDVARVTPLFEILGRQNFHLGPIGAGHAMKSINNLITAITFMATGEGLIAGKRYGLDPAVMIEVLNLSTGMSWVSQTHFAQRIFNRRFDDPFKLDLMVKDINIARQVATDLDLPLSEEARRLWLAAQESVPEASSVSAMIRSMEVKTGVDLLPGSSRTE